MAFTLGLVAIFVLLHIVALLGLKIGTTNRDKARIAAGIMFILSGSVLRIGSAQEMMAMIPEFLPLRLEAVYISGVFEILGGIGLLWPNPRIRRLAAYGLTALLLAIYPANINAALTNTQGLGFMSNPVYQWARLLFQPVYIAWLLWSTAHKMTVNPTLRQNASVVRQAH